MADPELANTFRTPFTEQIAAFRLRLGNQVPTSAWTDVWKEQHDRAFMVAGAAKADLLSDLATVMQKAIEQGTTLDEFRRDFDLIVAHRGWTGWTGEGSEAGRAWRTRVIFETNMRTSYMAGRYAQLSKPVFKYWIYKHSGAAEPRVEHLAWDGLVLEKGHPFWLTHFPPNGWGCGCSVFGAMSLDHAVRMGGDLTVKLPDNWRALDPRTGEPEGIDRGWGYAPGATVADDIERIARAKQGKLPDLLGQALADWAADILAGRGPQAPDAP